MMRKSKKIRTAAILAAALLLAGCSSYPSAAADGAAWDQSWTILGKAVGVEEPGHGLTLTENPVVLTGSDTHYAVWSAGAGYPFTNDQGDEALYYDAQLYVLASGNGDAAGAETAAEDWISREREVYEITGEETVEANGQTYTILSYRTKSETNPYDGGAVAIGTYKQYAVSFELTCLDAFSEDPAGVLGEILASVHYSADL